MELLTFLQILGGFVVAKFLYNQWKIFSLYFFARDFDFKGVAEDGYALITGGAEGIGKQCALYFAKKGVNLVLVDFNERKLDETAKEIKENYSISLITKVMDLTTLHDPEVYASFEKEMLKQKISILFNNAGMTEEKIAFWNYAGSTPSKVSKIMTLNAEVPVLMTRMVLPGMLERKKGVLMHMGSAAGLAPMDANPVYAATKSHVVRLKAWTSLTTFLTNGIKKKVYENTMERLKDIAFPKVETWFASAIKTVGTGQNESGGSWLFELFSNYLIMHFDFKRLKTIIDLSE
ncbi:Oidioi.mRNA.OKI2018_I69.PAR.g9686.t1.cds [Oikopleura dioica]|uniref:Oidioi.mRNA.OKI2018_I69.PAR.g9686.t1.cds n=1 Tax=Oikopleura dioica TaxID=34765 RepID=A0ABN7RS76_OIKDI|nr:Oidioi.mRNA.OKI2018_I69.PAR.g9686.t1.cds [Oikopleura dioica]